MVVIMSASALFCFIRTADDASAEVQLADDDLELYYSFDRASSSSVYDDSGHNRHGIIDGTGSNAEYTGNTLFGKALKCDVTSDYARSNTPTDAWDCTDWSGLTVEAWVFPMEVNGATSLINTGAQRIVAKEGQFNLEVYNGYPRFSTLGVYGNWVQSPDRIKPYEWSHIVGVWDGTSVHIYVNGISKSATSGTGSEMNGPDTSKVYIGCDYNGARLRFFYGIIDEVKIFSSGKTPRDGIGNCVLNLGFEEKEDTSSSSATIYDRSGFDQLCSQNGPVFTSDGVYGGGSLIFDGVNDMVKVYDDNEYLYRFEAITVEAWVKPTSGISDNDIVISKEGVYQIGYSTGGQIKAAVWTDTSQGWAWTGGTGSGTVPLNTWTHIAMTWDGTVVKLYINGEHKGTPYSLTGNKLRLLSTVTYIGRRAYFSAPERHWVGQIDNVRVYNYVKDIGLEVLRMPCDGFTYSQLLNDESPQNLDAISYGSGVTQESNGVYYEALNFDGTSSAYVDIGDSSNLGFSDEFSIECWIKDFDGHDAYDAICSRMNYDGGGYDGYALQFHGTTNRIRFHLGSDGTQRVISSLTTLNPNSWNHILVTYDHGVACIYINGYLDNRCDFGSYTLDTGLRKFYIGRLYADWSSNDFYYNGDIDNLIVYNYAKQLNEDFDGDGMSDKYEIRRGKYSDQFNSIEYNGRYVLLAGGSYDKGSNYASFWEDIAYTYILLKAVGYHDGDIIINYADGDKIDSGNSDEYSSALAKLNIVENEFYKTDTKNALAEIGDRETIRDSILIFITTHGFDDGPGEKGICFWGSQNHLDDEDFGGSDYFGEIDNYYRRITTVYSACYSGCLMNNIEGDNRICVTAGTASEETTGGAWPFLSPLLGFRVDWASIGNHEYATNWDSDGNEICSVKEAYDRFVVLETDDSPQIDDDGSGTCTSADGDLAERTFL